MALLGHSGSHAPQLMQSVVIVVAMKKTGGLSRFNYLFRFSLSIISPFLQLPKSSCYLILGRRTQVVKGEVCKTSMQRFESARRLHYSEYSEPFSGRGRTIAVNEDGFPATFPSVKRFTIQFFG